ncbi:MAG: phosphosulfolactate synthase [Thermoplasmata archaeon]|nr:phosphosulfolactate synthase [Thermoplasmata archaeon]
MSSVSPRESNEAFFPLKAPNPTRPRDAGITHVLDGFHGLSLEEVRPLAPYIDYVELGWGLPLLFSRDEVRRRVRAYHELGVEVATSGTLLEYAFSRGKSRRLIMEAREIGFDLVELSDGILPISPEELERLAVEARASGLDVFIEVGKKNPQNQLSLRETVDQVGRALALKPRKVILESRESGRGVGIYDHEGGIKWDWVHSIVAAHSSEDLIFGAPLESQQVGLLKELGVQANLGNVPLSNVASLASQRLGLRGDTFGTLHSTRTVKGPPATKFLYFLLESHGGLDQSELVRLSRLPRRTVQSALDALRVQGIVQETVSLHDSRKREYRLL